MEAIWWPGGHSHCCTLDHGIGRTGGGAAMATAGRYMWSRTPTRRPALASRPGLSGHARGPARRARRRQVPERRRDAEGADHRRGEEPAGHQSLRERPRDLVSIPRRDLRWAGGRTVGLKPATACQRAVAGSHDAALVPPPGAPAVGPARCGGRIISRPVAAGRAVSRRVASRFTTQWHAVA